MMIVVVMVVHKNKLTDVGTDDNRQQGMLVVWQRPDVRRG